MSDQKKNTGAFPGNRGTLRDAIPSADEGDALLDMLFDDAPNGGQEGQEVESRPTPVPGAFETKPPPPPGPAPVPPTPPTGRRPEPPQMPPPRTGLPRGEVVTPPGWAAGQRAPAPTMPEPEMEEVATRAFSIEDQAAQLAEEEALEAELNPDDDDRGDKTVVAPNVAQHLAQFQAEEPEPFDPVALGDEPDEMPDGGYQQNAEDATEAPVEASYEDGSGDAISYDAASYDEAEAVDVDASEEPAYEADVPVEDAEAPPPRPLTLSTRPVDFVDPSDEQEASFVLAQTPGLRESFAERAAWLLEEANLTPDKLKRSRILLVVAELYAAAGEYDAAADAAREAHQLAPSQPMTMRQHRAMASRAGDVDRVVEVLEAETRHAPSPEGKAHSAWLSSEIARLAQADEASSKKRAEQAMRALPSDPRPSVQRFTDAASQLPEPASLLKIRPAEPEALAALGQAFGAVGALRGAPLAKGAAPRHVIEAALAVRTAFGGKDHAALVAAISRLRDTSLREGATWLGALVAAARPETRGQAVADLREIASDSTLARRTLAALSIETQESVDPRDPNAFPAIDRVALAALDAARPHPAGLAAREMLASIMDEAAVETSGTDAASDVAYLTGAVVAALLPTGEQRLSRLRFVHAGGPGTRAAAILGRLLGSLRAAGPESREVLDAAITDLVQNAEPLKREWASYVRALGLELDIDAGSADRVAQAIATWGSDGERGADPAGMLVAALLAELTQDVERARSSYAEIHREDPSCEAIARASAGEGDPAQLARMLKEHADQLGAGPRRGVLLTECAIRFASLAVAAQQPAEEGTEPEPSPEAQAFSEESDQCAKAAAELTPQIPIAMHLGEMGARARGDQDALVEWLRFRREASDDNIEKAHDLTREALLISDGESSGASALLETALRARTNDFGLRDLYERLSPEPTADRSSWREARAGEIAGPEAARLAIEAALEYERAGDLDAAARCAKLAESHGDTELAPIAAYRFALAGFGTAELVEALLPQAREAPDPSVRLEIYERLAELDERGREDTASALLFRRTILEDNPSHIRTLRRVASALMGGGRTEELEPIAMELARNLEGGEAVAYAALASRLRPRWEDTAEPVAIAYAQSPRPLWAIRQMGAHGRARGDHAVAAQCDRELMTWTDRPSERSTLGLRAAQALRAMGELLTARQLLQESIGATPDHIVARLELASVLEASEDFAGAAAQVEAAAESISNPSWRLQLDSRAAELWQDRAQNVEKARAALERIVAVDPNNVPAFERLRQIYVASGARAELAELLGRRIDAVQDPTERVEMEVMRGRALAEVGDADAAKRALAAALDANPDHVEALEAFAELCFTDADYDGAEQALIRLARLTGDPEKQAAIYLRLGHLYDELLPNDERAELAYQEILKRRPTDENAREKLIALYRRIGQLPRALEEQNVLVAGAENPDDKCKRTVELAEILEESGETKKAESTLVVARKSFPKSDLALRALVKFYQRTGQAPAAAVLLDRAVADARRALGTGRFETFLFETLATAAELRNRADAAAVARAAVNAIEGDQVDLQGAGHAAGDVSLDDLLAPEVMTPAFRELLLRTGPMLDSAFPYDLEGVRAVPPPHSLASVGEEVRMIADAYGLQQIQLLVSNVLGQVCIPARSHPATIVMGLNLAAQEESWERTFLIHRAMKVLQANASVFARTAPIDLWPLLAAYLRVFSPQFSPQGVDAARFNEAFGRLSRAVAGNPGPDMATLAADVIGTIGNRASTLNSAINGWGSRAGLLAVGDSNIALSGIAWAGGNANGPPPSGKDRLTWIGRNAEARDLVIFSVSDPYVDARGRLGAG